MSHQPAATSSARLDAPAKAAGRVVYACDLHPPGLLWAGARRAGVAHARILGVDVSAALALPGVKAALTAADVQGKNRQGVAMKDQPVLADDRVRHRGDALALVVAESREVLEKALPLIQVELEELPGVFSPEAALAPGAPLIHDGHPTGNLLLEGRVTRGDGAAGLDECLLVVERVFDLPRQEHAYLETESGMAILQDDGLLVITASTQTPFRDRNEICEALGLEPEKVRVIAPTAGGAFGGKDGISVQSLLALAALACPGRPIKMWLGREESILMSPKRHPARVACRLGALADGTLHAVEMDLLYDTGPYDHLGTAVMVLGLEHCGGPYRIPHAELRGRVVYTNNPIGGAFRGFGVPQVCAAVELCLDELAHGLGLDPLEMRLKNVVAQGDSLPVGTELTCSAQAAACLRALAEHPLWRKRRQWAAQAPPCKRRGVGVAAAMHAMGYGPLIPDLATAKLELTEDGALRLYCGVVEMGQGNSVTFARMAASALGQDAAAVELVLPDTARTLPCGSASASRTTFTFANALLPAAQRLRQNILAAAARLWGLEGEAGLELVPEAVRDGAAGRTLSLAELAKAMPHEARLVTHEYQAPVTAQRLTEDKLVTMLGLPHRIFSFAAHLAAVEVDEITGAVEVKGYVAACDCGRLLNPALAEQQVQGAVAQGLGYALMEEMPSREGRILAPDLSTYLIPTALDLPPVQSVFVESQEPLGPLGMKGVGEVGIDPPLPAVGNAVATACVARPTEFPLTPERVKSLLGGMP